MALDNVNVKWGGHYWDTNYIEFSLIADFRKVEQFYSGFELGLTGFEVSRYTLALELTSVYHTMYPT